MNSFTHTTTPRLFHFQCYSKTPPPPSCSSFNRRPRFRRRLGNNNKTTTIYDKTNNTNRKLALSNPSPDSKLEAVIDLQSLENKFRQFLSSAKDAYSDIQTLVAVDSNRRIVLSCRRSTVEFAASLVLYSVVLGFALWVLGRLGSGIKGRFASRNRVVVKRRDRSLGGKEVVVAIEEGVKRRPGPREVDNQAALAQEAAEVVPGRAGRNWGPAGKRLPKWWPLSVSSSSVMVVDTQDYQKEANRLIRAMINNRTHGEDIAEDDIVQLRRICRTSGIRVSIDTANTRDSIYRTSVDFILNVCSSAPRDSSFIEIDGEDPRQFIAGLAENIGLDNTRAARIVSAAVAARTRSRFLQAWALEMQGKHSEMVVELSKICLILRIFPPDESSPEMEMVARGLEKHLKLEQREFLMNAFAKISDEESRRSAAESLGLVYNGWEPARIHEI